MNYKKILPIISILIILSISLVLSQEDPFPDVLSSFQDTNDPTIFSENVKSMTPEQQQEMIDEIKPDFWRNWEGDLDKAKKQQIWENLDQTQRDSFMNKYGEEYGNVKFAGFNEEVWPGDDTIFGNPRAYFRGSDLEAYNKKNPDNPITEVSYEKTENGHILKMTKKDGSITLEVGDNERGYFFDPETNKLTRWNSDRVPDESDPLSGKWNGQGHIKIESTDGKSKITLKTDNPEEATRFTSFEGTDLSTYQRNGKSNQALITFNEDGTIDKLSNTYLSRDNHDFFTGEDTKFFGSKDAFEKARESLGDGNILAYDAKEGFLYQKSKGTNFIEDFTPLILESARNGKVKYLEALRDLKDQKYDTPAVKFLRENLEGIDQDIEAYRLGLENLNQLDLVLGKPHPIEELSSRIFDETFIIPAREILDNNPKAAQFTKEQVEGISDILKNRFHQIAVGTISEDIGDVFSEGNQELAQEKSRILLNSLSNFQEGLNSDESLSRYHQDFMQSQINGNLRELVIDGGKAYIGDELIVTSSEFGIAIDKNTAATSNHRTFYNIDSINSNNGGSEFRAFSDRFGNPKVTRTGSETVTFGGTGLFGQVSREDGFFANLFEGGTQYSVGTVNTQVERAEYEELLKLYNSGDPKDKTEFYARLADSDYAIDIDLSTYSSSGRVGQEAAGKKASKIYYEGLPALERLSTELESSVGKPLSLSGEDSKSPNGILSRVMDISREAVGLPGGSELERSMSNLLSNGESLVSIRDMTIKETERVVQFLENSITSYGGDLRTIKYEGGSGLYQISANGKQHIIDPTLGPLVHTVMPTVLDTMGSSSGNVVYDSSGSRVFHPGTWNVVATTSGIDPTLQGVARDPRYIERIVNPTTVQQTQITQTPTTRTQTPTQTTQYRYQKNSPRYFGRTGQMRYKRERAKGWVQ